MHHNSSNVHALINIILLASLLVIIIFLLLSNWIPSNTILFCKIKFVTCLGRLVWVDEEVYLLNGKI